jgi:hypothetical protein
MGNDLDVCSKDEHLQKFYDQNYGPQNESIFQFVYRTYNKFCDSLIHPPRINYQYVDLLPKFSDPDERNLWTIEEFDVISQGNRLHCCYWRYKDPDKDTVKTDDISSPVSPASPTISSGDQKTSPKRLCLVYLPTNQRALNEATEIFPLAKELKCDVFSFDFAGCGKSDGGMHERIDYDIENVLSYLQSSYCANYQLSLILWARGMSTALVLLFLSRLTKQQLQYQEWKQKQQQQAEENNITPKRSSKRWSFGISSRKENTSSNNNSGNSTPLRSPPPFVLASNKKETKNKNNKENNSQTKFSSFDNSSTSSNGPVFAPESAVDPSHSNLPIIDPPANNVDHWEQNLHNQLNLLQIVKCLVLDSPFTSIEDVVRAGMEKMKKKGFMLTKSIMYFVIKTVMRNICKKLNGFNIFSIKPVEEIPYLNYLPCFILAAENDDYIPSQFGETMSKLWKNLDFDSNPDSMKTEKKTNDNYFYGNIQFNTFPGRHFPRREGWIVEKTMDFVKAHALYYNNHRFDTNQWYYNLERQIRETQLKEKEMQKEGKLSKLLDEEGGELGGDDENDLEQEIASNGQDSSTKSSEKDDQNSNKQQQTLKKETTTASAVIEAPKTKRFQFFSRREVTKTGKLTAKSLSLHEQKYEKNELIETEEEEPEGVSILHENIKVLHFQEEHFSHTNFHAPHTTYFESFDDDGEDEEDLDDEEDEDDDDDLEGNQAILQLIGGLDGRVASSGPSSPSRSNKNSGSTPNSPPPRQHRRKKSGGTGSGSHNSKNAPHHSRIIQDIDNQQQQQQHHSYHNQQQQQQQLSQQHYLKYSSEELSYSHGANSISLTTVTTNSTLSSNTTSSSGKFIALGHSHYDNNNNTNNNTGSSMYWSASNNTSNNHSYMRKSMPDFPLDTIDLDAEDH